MINIYIYTVQLSPKLGTPKPLVFLLKNKELILDDLGSTHSNRSTWLLLG